MPAPGPILYKVHNYEQCSKAHATTDAHIQGWPCTQEWVRGGLILKSVSGGGLILRSGVGSDSEVGRGGLKLRSGVGSDSEVGQGWAHTQKWGGPRLRSGSGVGSNSEVG